MEMTKEIKAIDQALEQFYNKHKGKVSIVASVIAFDDEGKVCDDRLYTVGEDLVILAQLEGIEEELNNR